MKISRRRFLKMGLVGGVGLALPLGTLSIPLSHLAASSTLRSPSVAPFEVPLPIPPILKPVRTDAGADYYEMTQKAGSQEILPGLKTEVWGYDGILPARACSPPASCWVPAVGRCASASCSTRLSSSCGSSLASGDSRRPSGSRCSRWSHSASRRRWRRSR